MQWIFFIKEEKSFLSENKMCTSMHLVAIIAFIRILLDNRYDYEEKFREENDEKYDPFIFLSFSPATFFEKNLSQLFSDTFFSEHDIL